MAKRNKIVKIRLNDKYFDEHYNSYYHSRENPVVLGRRLPDGDFKVQGNPAKSSYSWFVHERHAAVVNKPLILISVSEDTRTIEPQAQK